MKFSKIRTFKWRAERRLQNKCMKSMQCFMTLLPLIATDASSIVLEDSAFLNKSVEAMAYCNVAQAETSIIHPAPTNKCLSLDSKALVLSQSVNSQRAEEIQNGFDKVPSQSSKQLALVSAQIPLQDSPPKIAQELGKRAAEKADKRSSSSIEVLAQHVRTTLNRNPQVFQYEAESRAAQSRLAESHEGFKPRVTLSSNLALENQSIDATAKNNRFNQHLGQVRAIMPIYDPALTAQLNQRLSSSLGADWKLTDVREQLMLKTIETYIELARNTNLVKLAQENLKNHRQYVSLMKDISRSDLGRSSDLPTVVARVALAESVLTSRLGKLEATRASWKQLTGLVADQEFGNLPQVKLPDTLDSLVELAFEFNPIIQSAQADVITAQRGIDVAKAPYAPRVNAELSYKSGSDWGGVYGMQTNKYAGISVEWTVWAGKGAHYANQTALEGIASARASLDRVREELRMRVEQTWFEMQTSHASMRSFVDYAYNAQLMVAASKDQFKIGRRSLIEVLNAESELFTARSNIESTLQDLSIASWRLHSMQGRIQAELEL